MEVVVLYAFQYKASYETCPIGGGLISRKKLPLLISKMTRDKLIILSVLIFMGISNISCVRENTIKASVGEVVSITLVSNATTGYAWQIRGSVDGGILKLVDSEYIPDEANPMIVGAGGKEIWTFKALKKGKAKLCFEYVRPWEKDVSPAKIEDRKSVV